MASFQINIAFDGVWDNNNIYKNFERCTIHVPNVSTLDEFHNSLSQLLSLDPHRKISQLSLFRNVEEKSLIMRLNEDRDLVWVLTGYSHNKYNDCVLVVDTAAVDTGSYSRCRSIKLKRTASRESRVVHFVDPNRIDTLAENIQIVENCVFDTKANLKKLVYGLALKGNFQFRTTRSNAKQFTVNCIEQSCSWSLYASVYGTGSMWVVRKFINEHTCPIDIVKNDHRQATATVVSEYATTIMSTNNKKHCTPKDIIRYARKHHGVSISYDKAWRGREKAFTSIRGSAEESYARIPTFAARLIEKNPGTYTAQEVGEDNRFKFFFMSLAASISGWEHCLSVITVDGTSLKNKFNGTLLTACTFDGNSQTYPLAVSVVDSENDASWGWFFQNLKAVFGEPKDLVIVSDRHKSIANGFRSVYTSAHHVYCNYHLVQNLKTDHRGKPIEELFQKCAKAYTSSVFDYYMRQMEQLVPSIRNELEGIGLCRWSRAFSTKKRYTMMTTNISESFNSRLSNARELPIISLLEEVRDILQEWFFERRTCTIFRRQDITQYAQSQLRDTLNASRTMDINPVNDYQFEIRDDRKQFEVNLTERSCTCRRWDEDLIPCSHACRAICHKGFTLENYVHDFYRTSTLQKLYSGDIHPISLSYDDVDASIPCDTVVHPPLARRPAGRPKKKRITSHRERATTLKCGRCGKAGHNRRRCNTPLP